MNAMHEHTTLDGEPHVCIRNVDAMDPFLMNIVSNGNLWIFAGSNGALTAGRRNPDMAIFPYQTADKLLRHPQNSGALTIFRIDAGDHPVLWAPGREENRSGHVARHLHKHAYGTSLVYQEVHAGLGLDFSWRLSSSQRFGLVRHCRLLNTGAETRRVRYLDGWHNVLPHGVLQETYASFSYLVAAYMRHEVLPAEGLAIYTLNSRITDRAEPSEALRCSCAWSLGHGNPVLLLSERQIERFRNGEVPKQETEIRGDFGAYLAVDTVEIPTGGSHEWYTVVDIGLDHAAVTRLKRQLREPGTLKAELLASLDGDVGALRKRIAAADGLQQTGDATASLHHFANTLFNCMRGGVFDDGTHVPGSDFAGFIKVRNAGLYARHRKWLDGLNGRIKLDDLYGQVDRMGDRQLKRLTREYLPVSFSRRHGDPSRPWNRFDIETQTADGLPIYTYQGNWRDIFQNWEGLSQSYPAYLDAMISVFLNASTADGYNPYRITRNGIDWEVHDPANPWSHIGYWGDHQIIYLLRLLENHERFWPGQLAASLDEARYASAVVPYEIGSFEAVVKDPQHSIRFNDELHRQLLARADQIGGDGKLLADASGEVFLVSLVEKLLTPLLVKLSNLVPGGGIWMNTQRPEWNDANNALAGWGLSMVTACYIRRYLAFLQEYVRPEEGTALQLTQPVADLLRKLTGLLSRATEPLDDRQRYGLLAELGAAGEEHRTVVYRQTAPAFVPVSPEECGALLAAAMRAIDATIRSNRRADGMYHSYNLLDIRDGQAGVRHMNLMLEGQVAVLSCGLLAVDEALALLRALRASDLYRADQRSYLLYPDREVKPYLTRNTLPSDWMKRAPALANLMTQGNRTVVAVDEDGGAHFQADLTNVTDLEKRLEALSTHAFWRDAIQRERHAILELWEEVFQHRAFTGRSGTMFAFEGLGSIYWHMVAKLLLAVQECHRDAASGGSSASVESLRQAYHEVRNGLGFTKTPEVYGAFPIDPYSHTPRHRGAQQPGMTGQVKEELLTRMGELGVEIKGGCVTFRPQLLQRSEFSGDAQQFSYVDVTGADRQWALPANSLAFTFCQVPVCYVLGNEPVIVVRTNGGGDQKIPGRELPAKTSRELFLRTGSIESITVTVVERELMTNTTGT